jgi:hypothetical protein
MFYATLHNSVFGDSGNNNCAVGYDTSNFIQFVLRARKTQRGRYSNE